MDKCETCGQAKQRWELRCAICALASDMPDDWYILLVAPSLRYRLIRFVASLAGALTLGAIVYFGAAPTVQVLSSLVSGALLTILALILLLIFVVVILGCVTVAYLAYDQLRSSASFAVSKTKIRFSDVFKDYDTIVDDLSGEPPTSTQFIEREIKLASVRRTAVKQGRLGQWLSYGDVEIYTDQNDKPTMLIAGVVNPHVFREKLELLVNARH